MEKKEEHGTAAIITTTELTAIVLIVAAVIIAAVIQPEQTGIYLGFGGTIIASLLAASKAQRAVEQGKELRIEVNHRMTELLEARTGEARAAGRDEQRVASEVARVDQRDELKADRKEMKDELQEDAAPVEVVNLPAVQQVEIVQPKEP